MDNNKRIAKWDNVKFWMILCVVVGHVMNCFRGNTTADIIYTFVYSFHMPVMIFVAGMFSRNCIEQKRYETVINYIAVYLIMKVLEAASTYIVKGSFSYHFLWESGPAWFALAMAVFILTTMFISRYNGKYIFAIALLAGCFAILDTHFGDHFASMRIMVFYPVFLAGFYSRPEMFDLSGYGISIRLMSRIAGVIVLACVGCIMYRLRGNQLTLLLGLFKGKYAYDDLGIGIESVGFRLACYILWIVMIAAVIVVIGNQNTVLTWIGSRSMSVFIWHNIIIDIVCKKLEVKDLLLGRMPHLYFVSALAIAMMITVIASYLPDFRMSYKLRKEH